MGSLFFSTISVSTCLEQAKEGAFPDVDDGTVGGFDGITAVGALARYQYQSGRSALPDVVSCFSLARA